MALRILVAEDDRSVAQLLVEVLGLRGDIVDLVESSEKAIEAELPDFGLTDLGLKDGAKAGEKVVKHLIDHGVPVIVISGKTDVKDHVLSLGADAFIQKPFDVTTLREVVLRVLLDRNIAQHTEP